MKKKMIIFCSILAALAMGVAVGFQDVDAADVEHKCYVPYNIKTGSWNTGLHIVTEYFDDYLEIYIWCGNTSSPNKIVYLDMDPYPKGWTGTIQDLFDLPEYLVGKEVASNPVFNASTLQSPAFLTIYSAWGGFMVSQFIISAVSGYGFQTFYSWPSANGWPYQKTILSEPLSELENLESRPSRSGRDHIDKD